MTERDWSTATEDEIEVELDRIMAMSEDELRAECTARGGDFEQEAAHTRQILMSALDQWVQAPDGYRLIYSSDERSWSPTSLPRWLGDFDSKLQAVRACERDMFAIANRIGASAAVEALNAIASLCGCSEWDYPGQIVRDVRAVCDARQALEAEIPELRAAIADPQLMTMADRRMVEHYKALVDRTRELERELVDAKQRVAVAETKLAASEQARATDREAHHQSLADEYDARRQAERAKEDLGQQILRLKADLAPYWRALQFYADPHAYFACSFAFDRPTGGFDEDFETIDGHDVPGKRARAVLAGEYAIDPDDIVEAEDPRIDFHGNLLIAADGDCWQRIDRATLIRVIVEHEGASSFHSDLRAALGAPHVVSREGIQHAATLIGQEWAKFYREAKSDRQSRDLAAGLSFALGTIANHTGIQGRPALDDGQPKVEAAGRPEQNGRLEIVDIDNRSITVADPPWNTSCAECRTPLTTDDPQHDFVPVQHIYRSNSWSSTYVHKKCLNAWLARGLARSHERSVLEQLTTTNSTQAVAMTDKTTQRSPDPAPAQVGPFQYKRDEGDWSWCGECHLVIDGRCQCFLHQDGVDSSQCPAHKRQGMAYGRCKCTVGWWEGLPRNEWCWKCHDCNAPCCNPKCDGDWGTNCYHCHHPRFEQPGDRPVPAPDPADEDDDTWIKDPAYEPQSLEQKIGYLVEECGEVLSAVGKTIRWGLASVNPALPVEQQETNKAWILRELPDLRKAIAILRTALRRVPD